MGGVGLRFVRAQGLAWALMLPTERWWVTPRELFASRASLHLPRGRAHLCFPITGEKKLGREGLEAKERGEGGECPKPVTRSCSVGLLD